MAVLWSFRIFGDSPLSSHFISVPFLALFKNSDDEPLIQRSRRRVDAAEKKDEGIEEKYIQFQYKKGTVGQARAQTFR